MNKVKKYKELIITAIIAIILTLLILSIKINAVIGDPNLNINDISEVKTTTKLAWFVANQREKHMAYTADDIFKLNLGGGLSVSNKNYTDINYNTCACWYHDQGNQQLDGYKVKISNIIDITTPGTMTIYIYTGNKKEVKYDYKTMEFTGEERQKMAAFAYLAYYTGEFGTYHPDIEHGRRIFREWLKYGRKRDGLLLDVGG